MVREEKLVAGAFVIPREYFNQEDSTQRVWQAARMSCLKALRELKFIVATLKMVHNKQSGWQHLVLIYFLKYNRWKSD